MDVKLNGSSGIRPAYYKKQPCASKAKTASVSGGRKKDSVEISPEGREQRFRVKVLEGLEEECGARGGGVSTEPAGGETARFVPRLDEFENSLPLSSPVNRAAVDVQAMRNVWNQTEPSSRAGLLTELEKRYGVRETEPSTRQGGETARFASFLDEFDKLLFSDAPSNMAVMDMQANQNVRNQMEQSLQTLFAQAGVQIPEGVSFRLTAAPGDYYIRVHGLHDQQLARKIEEAVNIEDNGRKLYNHIQYCNPARFGYEEPVIYAAGHGLGLDYTEGRLADIGTKYGYGPGQTGWQDHLREQPEEAELRYMEQAGRIAGDLENVVY